MRAMKAEGGDKPENTQPQLVPKGVAWSMGAGLLGLVVGGALVGFTAAVVAPAVRNRVRRYREDRENRLEKT
jgi:hypothetical protein